MKWLWVPCLPLALWCLYKCLDYGITAEEGMKYTVPHLPPLQRGIETARFIEMAYRADMYGWISAGLVLIAVLPVVAGASRRVCRLVRNLAQHS